ncbi:UPF0187-domain-containing protein [Ascodesmis nigricans]|uniref:UPF0187-domain-containing protein n=1 Tax=Ascodesmis nigricans TaxID=341454 RepID=A0A4S2N0T3_9PEZI|nr:UPF0187-domain-containing protein [Ascodesmis nigricans]
MRSRHHHPPSISTAPLLRKWHRESRQRRLQEPWVPYTLRLRGGLFRRILPQIVFTFVYSAFICYLLSTTSLRLALRSPILFTAFGFIVSIAISFRMTASYNRWWEGRTQWDHLSAVSRNIARTVWVHTVIEETEKRRFIRTVIALQVALKHHLRGEREWERCNDLQALVEGLGVDYPTTATNHPITLTVLLSHLLDRIRLTSTIDTQVLTHLLTHLDTLTCITSSCERLLRTPIPLSYNIAICRLIWCFVLCIPSQLWVALRWYTVPATVIGGYLMFLMGEVGIEIENPFGWGPNDLDLERYVALNTLDLEEIMGGGLTVREAVKDGLEVRIEERGYGTI